MSSSVLVVGAGLIGTSIGLALRGDRDVLLQDPSQEHLSTAQARGAGRPWTGEQVGLVIVAAPPARVASLVGEHQRSQDRAFFTHVASIQSRVQHDIEAAGCDQTSLCGGHPLAGRETAGPAAAAADLFEGRPWVLCPTGSTRDEALAAVQALVTSCGANGVVMTAEDHDRAVALVSHLPQVAASAVAARLVGSPDAVAVSGPGLQDTTRIAASDPALWTDILVGNARFVGPLVRDLAADLARLSGALAQVTDQATGEMAAGRAGIADLLRRGQSGRGLVPVKRGDHDSDFTRVAVSVPDAPGQLAGVFVCAADAGVNIEDVRVEHLPGRPTGVLELLVHLTEREALQQALTAAGFAVIRTA